MSDALTINRSTDTTSYMAEQPSVIYSNTNQSIIDRKIGVVVNKSSAPSSNNATPSSNTDVPSKSITLPNISPSTNKMQMVNFNTAEELADLLFHVKNSMQIFQPVFFLMIFVVLMKRNFECFNRAPLLAMLIDFSDSTGEESLSSSLIMGGGILVTIILSTFGLMLLFINGYDKIIEGYMYMIVITISLVLSMNLISELAEECNVALDYVTLALLCYNYAALAGASILTGKTPLVLQQTCLLTNVSMLVLYIGNYAPRRVIWVLLFLIIAWDLIAVLPAWGPLRQLLESSEKRDKQIMPAMLYSTMAWFHPRRKRSGKRRSCRQSSDDTDDSNENINNNITDSTIVKYYSENIQQEKDDIKKDDLSSEGIQLGMGDFVFYAVFVGLTCNTESVVSLACICSVVYGLAITLALMVTYEMSVPALPISIVFGLFTYMVMYYCVNPMFNKMQFILVFI